MINELIDASKTLSALGIIRPALHPHLAPMPNGRFYTVSLDEYGRPETVEVLNSAGVGLYKIRRDPTAANAASFPGLNVPVCLAKPDTDKAKNQAKTFQRCTRDYIANLQETFVNAPIALTNFCKLLKLVAESEFALTDFHASMTRLIPQHDEKAKKNRRKAPANKTFSVYLDLAPRLRNPLYPRVAHAKTSALINEHLWQIPSSNGSGICHATGQQTDVTTQFPTMSVPALGRIKLYVLNTEAIPALQRYGLEKSFSVSSTLVQELSDTLRYLTDSARKNKTWSPIPSSRPKQTDLLVVYPSADVQLLEELPGAQMLGHTNSWFSNSTFEAICRPAIKLLQAKLPANPDLKLRLLIFSKVSPGEQQISLCRDIRVPELIESCNQWKLGAANAPILRLPDKDYWHKSLTPYPLALVAAVNRVWKPAKQGIFISEVQPGISASDAFDIFLWQSPLKQRKAERALTLLVQRMIWILTALGRSQVIASTQALKIQQSPKDILLYAYNKFSAEVRTQALRTIPLLGILLFQLEYQLTTFMNHPIHQLGRLLKLADDLHIQYCIHVRKGQIPTQLIGNSFFMAAIERPLPTFVQLQKRINPYLAWAKSVRVEESTSELRLAIYLLGQINDCIGLISQGQFPERMTTIDQAQLIFGYHSRSQRKETLTEPELLVTEVKESAVS